MKEKSHRILLTVSPGQTDRPVNSFRQHNSQDATSMITGLYSAATAMDASTLRHELAANNLANVQMPGYRRQVLTNSRNEFQLAPQLQPKNNGSLAQTGTASEVSYDFSLGHLENTGRPLDLALTDDGFFSVRGPDGPLYTRNGSFYVNQERQLVTVDNLPVLGTGGPIVLPADVSSEQIEVARDGRIYAGAQEIGQLEIVQFPDNSALTPAGNSLFAAPDTAVPVPSDSEVLQHHLELANTSSVDELINLIKGTRHFEAAQKALTTLAESIQKRIGLNG